MKKNRQLLCGIMLLVATAVHAQTFEWAKQNSGFYFGLMSNSDGNLVVANTQNMIECFNQQGDTLWTKSYEGQVRTNDIAQDADGNYYFTGSFNGTATFGKDKLTAGQGGYDIFISKLDASRNFVWTKQISATSYSNGASLVFDGNGHLYFGGSFTGDCSIGSTNLHAVGQNDILLAKLDEDGNIMWAKSFGGPNSDIISAMRYHDAKLTMSGTFGSQCQFGTIQLTGASTSSSYLCSISADGTPMWAKAYDNCTIYDLYIGANNKTYITGGIKGKVDFGSGKTLTTTNTYGDVFLAQLKNDTVPEWVTKSATGTYFNSGQRILADANGEVYVSGSYSDKIQFGTLKASSHGEDDMFIVKYGSDGQPQWLKAYGGPGEDGAGDMVFSKDGKHLFIEGYLQDGPIQLDGITMPGDGGGATFIGSMSGKLTGIDEAVLPVTSFRIYPNPATSQVNLEWAQPFQQPIQVRVSDITGRLVLEKWLPAGESRMQLDHLTSGIYLVNTANTNQQALKLVVY